MKKLLVLVLLLTVFAWPVIAEEIDLAAMSLDELLALQARVEGELSARLEEDEMVLLFGTYTVGLSLAPGRYVVRCPEQTSFMTYVYFDQTCLKNEDVLYSMLLYDGQTGHLELEDGMILHVVSSGGSTITPVK